MDAIFAGSPFRPIQLGVDSGNFNLTQPQYSTRHEKRQIVEHSLADRNLTHSSHKASHTAQLRLLLHSLKPPNLTRKFA